MPNNIGLLGRSFRQLKMVSKKKAISDPFVILQKAEPRAFQVSSSQQIVEGFSNLHVKMKFNERFPPKSK